MKFVLLTNTLNPHMKALGDSLYNLLGDEFVFITTDMINNERLGLGWSEFERVSYHLPYWEDPERAKRLILSSEVVYFGANRNSFEYIY